MSGKDVLHNVVWGLTCSSSLLVVYMCKIW